MARLNGGNNRHQHLRLGKNTSMFYLPPQAPSDVPVSL
jgi:hypothetical protein